MQSNRLIREKSPYLLQHAHNPVDWFPWGEEAFAKSRRENKPIFLSVGYATCHWCHVMARECFEQPEVANILNRDFVSIKVDREERPDVDQIYMQAVQLLTGSGGWPMSVFLTPEGKPFYGGTYFPRSQFEEVLQQLAAAFRDRFSEITRAADELTEAISGFGATPNSPAPPGPAAIESALLTLSQLYDRHWGGFGRAPKFPPHNSFPLIFREYRKGRRPDLLEMATHTLEAMALGGIQDHLGGGFHRYATDARWFAPHFEKMLYDNALLLRAYSEGFLLSKNFFFLEVAQGIFSWLKRDLLAPEGAFYSALDADSEGGEGRFYLWKRDEILSLLGRERGESFCRSYGVTVQGNFQEEATGQHTGRNILFLPQSLSARARELGLPATELADGLRVEREILLLARSKRPHPRRDDKILTSWNGLLIGSLAYAGRDLAEPSFTEAANRAADFLLSELCHDGKLLHRWREGQAALAGYLEDYAELGLGLLELYETTGEVRRLSSAQMLAEEMLAGFWDKQSSSFYYTAAEHADLVIRPKEIFDHALPSSNSRALLMLIKLGKATGDSRYLDFAERSLWAMSPWLRQAPQAMQSLARALSEYLEVRPLSSPAPVRVSAVSSNNRLKPGECFAVDVTLDIAEGWHIAAPTFGVQGFPVVTISLAGGPAEQIGEVVFPAGTPLSSSEGETHVYQGHVVLSVPLRIMPDAAKGAASLLLSVTFQACGEGSCRDTEKLSAAAVVEIT
jgi:uncharacterized protein